MIVYRCDKCKAEGDVTHFNEVLVDRMRAHLCDQCYDALRKWLNWS